MRLDFRWDDSAARDKLVNDGMSIARQAAEYLAARARQLAPVDTGLMVSRIDVVPETDGKRWNVVVDTFYAQFVEFGHLSRGGTWVAPNPFLRMAVADTAANFSSIAAGAAVKTPYGSGADVMHVRIGD